MISATWSPYQTLTNWYSLLTEGEESEGSSETKKDYQIMANFTNYHNRKYITEENRDFLPYLRILSIVNDDVETFKKISGNCTGMDIQRILHNRAINILNHVLEENKTHGMGKLYLCKYNERDKEIMNILEKFNIPYRITKCVLHDYSAIGDDWVKAEIQKILDPNSYVDSNFVGNLENKMCDIIWGNPRALYSKPGSELFVLYEDDWKLSGNKIYSLFGRHNCDSCFLDDLKIRDPAHLSKLVQTFATSGNWSFLHKLFAEHELNREECKYFLFSCLEYNDIFFTPFCYPYFIEEFKSILEEILGVISPNSTLGDIATILNLDLDLSRASKLLDRRDNGLMYQQFVEYLGKNK